MNKRKIIIIGIVAFLILIAFLSIYLRSKNTPTTNTDDGFGLSDLFPFGSNTNRDDNTNNGSGNNPDDAGLPIVDTPAADEIIPKLRQISTFPISGATSFNTLRKRIIPIPVITSPIGGDAGGDPSLVVVPPTEEIITEEAVLIRYMEQSTSHVYDTYTDMLLETRISNTTIPRIHDTFWNTDGTSVVFRYLEDGTNFIQTYLAALTEESIFSLGGNTEDPTVLKNLKGSYLTENITDISISPDKTRFFTLEPIVGGTVGITSDFLGEKKVQIFQSPLSEWISEWPTASTVTLTTKATGTLGGFMYSVDVNKKSFDKVLGGIIGLTTKMSPDGKTVLYSASVPNGVRLYSYNMNTKLVTDLGMSTLPEKCVWSKDSTILYCAVPKSFFLGTYPDLWYQGRTSFSDVLWRMNLGSSTYYILIDPDSSQNTSLDMTHLFLDPNEEYIFFTNKKDGILWNYAI